jgi:hypothetical protein
MTKMDSARLVWLLEMLGLGNAAAANFLDYDDRTLRRWRAGTLEVPIVVAMLLELMVETGWTTSDVNELVRGTKRRPQ